MPSTTHRMPAPDRRRQLIEAAMDLFSLKGFAGTTTKEIALAAGVSEAIIFRHFATKRDLYTAIIEHTMHSAESKETMATLKACMERNDDEGLFRLLAQGVITAHRKDPRFQKLIRHACLEGHELSHIYRNEFGMPIFSTLRAYLERRQRSGALRPIDPGFMIVALVGMADYYAWNAEGKGEKIDGLPLKDNQAVDALLGIMMDGVRNPSDSQKKKNSK